MLGLRQQLRAKGDEVLQLQESLSASQQQVEELMAQLRQVQEQHEADKRKLGAVNTELRAAAFAAKQLENKLRDAEQRLREAEQVARDAGASGGVGGGSGPAPAVDMSMVEMMEKQLGRLSEIIRTREAELAELRRAFQAGCDERRELMQQIERLMSGGQQGSAGPASSARSEPSAQAQGSHVGMPTSPGSRRAVVSTSPNKPYRTGLTSKPKFK